MHIARRPLSRANSHMACVYGAFLTALGPVLLCYYSLAAPKMPDISADKFQHYSLYYGHEGHCADGEILSNLKISSFENVVQTCDANPNCTFISYYFEANSAKLCSGREFTYKSSIYVDAVVSGDKRGCESFDTKVARIFHRQNKLPTCSDKGNSFPILINIMKNCYAHQ